jgi:hypothetical protein
MRAVLVFLVGCAGCAGGGGRGDGGCSSGADCGPDEGCFDGDEVVCGMAPQEGCGSDADCFTGQSCSAIADGCSQDGVGSACQAPCTGDEACGPGFRCGPTGGCEVIPCEDGDCRAGEVCDPSAIPAETPVHGRHAGCVAVSCAADPDCPDAAFCVNGSCGPNPGACGEVMLVP